MALELQTKRLILRQITKQDADLIFQLYHEPEVIRYVCDPLSDEVIQQRFESRLPLWNKESPHWLALTLIDKASGQKIGISGFLSEWEPYQQAELGFLLLPEFQGRGYGTESLQRVLELAFDELGFHKVKATVTEGNSASSRLLTRLGFRLEGRLRDNFKLAGCWQNDLMYGLLREEFHNLASAGTLG
ncbi:GNAT family N-acetyltransferase [Dongshaea marina]|uniref:GNAT family N-acetyltransferase n=1 Tax=Dongshaea marina TaxID=2047966 RepID=UPI000D3E77B4|nr:GNAT family protein [Dongshaea marina]